MILTKIWQISHFVKNRKAVIKFDRQEMFNNILRRQVTFEMDAFAILGLKLCLNMKEFRLTLFFL